MNDVLDRLVGFYENLQPDTLGAVSELYAADARFKDPFNDVVGHEAIVRIFEHMFANLEAPRFVVTARIVSENRAALEWTFSFVMSGRSLEVHGPSVLVCGNDGRLSPDRDYWDPAEERHAELPAVGVVFRWLRRRMSATAS